MACNVVALPTALIPAPPRCNIDPLAPPEGVTAFRPWVEKTIGYREARAARDRAITTDPTRTLLLGTIEALEGALAELGISDFGRLALREAQTIAPRLDISMNVLCADAHYALYKARGGPRPAPSKRKRPAKGKKS